MRESATISVTTSLTLSNVSRLEPRWQFDAVLDGREAELRTILPAIFFRAFGHYVSTRRSFSSSEAIRRPLSLSAVSRHLDNGPHNYKIV